MIHSPRSVAYVGYSDKSVDYSAVFVFCPPSVVLGPFYGRGLGGQGGFVLVTHRGICAGGGHLKV